MTVKELKEELEKLPDELDVKMWNFKESSSRHIEQVVKAELTSGESFVLLDPYLAPWERKDGR